MHVHILHLHHTRISRPYEVMSDRCFYQGVIHACVQMWHLDLNCCGWTRTLKNPPPHPRGGSCTLLYVSLMVLHLPMSMRRTWLHRRKLKTICGLHVIQLRRNSLILANAVLSWQKVDICQVNTQRSIGRSTRSARKRSRSAMRDNTASSCRN